MNTITRAQATDEQLEDIHYYIHQYMDILGNCFDECEEFNVPVEDSIKVILGLGVKSGALGQFKNLEITDDEITFNVWIRVNTGGIGLYYKLKTIVSLEEKRASVIEEE